MYIKTNPNPEEKTVDDCTIRAIALATDKTWEEVAAHTFCMAFDAHDMPSSNKIWSQYLMGLGWRRKSLPDTCPACYTFEDFAQEHPKGTFIVCGDGHVACVKDGNLLDNWYSGDETAYHYWMKEE